MPQAPTAPGDVLIERWLGYERQRRNVVHEKPLERTRSLAAPKNVVVDWEAVDRTQLRRHYNFLGVETVDPTEYERRHGTQLVEASRLPAEFATSELNARVPSGETLATSSISQQHDFILTGDVDALRLVEGRHDLTQYLRPRF